MVRTDAIEADGWESIEELFSDPIRLKDKLKQAQQNEEDAQKPIREKLQITEDFIRHAESEAAKIAAALPDAEKGRGGMEVSQAIGNERQRPAG